MLHASSIELDYRITGSGNRNVVLLHGFCENSALWENVLPLETQCKVITIDLPGFGNSTITAPDDLTISAEIIANLLTHLNITNPIIFGHSMGGYIAARMLADNMIKSLGLGMVHSTFFEDSDDKKQNRLKTIEFIQNNNLSAFLKVFTPGLLSEQHATNTDMLKQASAFTNNNNSYSVCNALLAMRNRKATLQWLENTELPVLIVAGKHDLHVPFKQSIKEASLCKRGLLKVFDDCGHLSQVEQPKKLTAAIDEFIQWVDLLQ